jgi:outer membrane receptor protein involved in Fe transport
MVKNLFALCLFTLCVLFPTVTRAQSNVAVKGTVIDKEFNEPLPGATIQILGTTTGVVSDADGKFEFPQLKHGKYSFSVSFIGYEARTIQVDVREALELSVALEPDNRTLDEVTVTTRVKRNTETALLARQRNSLVTQTGVSAQMIARTQDRDASEVIRRIPGISIIEEKFVMVRGLSQRYNNVWINGNAAPSSEADARAFSFDIVPSAQLDNLLVVKSPAPEYPADFSGGFILVNTKDMPDENTFNFSLGTGVNDRTHFHDFLYARGSSTDFLGFDNGLRSLNKGINADLRIIADNGIDRHNNGFNNDWTVRRYNPLTDINLGLDFSRRINTRSGSAFALTGAANYGSSHKTYLNMQNSLFGAWDVTNNKPNYLRRSVDDRYTHNVRLGAMLNLAFAPADGKSRYEFKNIFNRLGQNRYTFRSGISAQSDNEESAEYCYSSRSTYNSQFTAKYAPSDESSLDLSIGYAFSNRNMPDRRLYLVNDALETGRLGLSNANDVNREFTQLSEHIFSASLNYSKEFHFDLFNPQIKAGAYTDYRTRSYHTRMFIYNWNASDNSLPSGFRYMNIPSQLLQPEYYGEKGLYLLEKVKWSNNYAGDNLLTAGYLGVTVPFGKISAGAGIRFERNKMVLTSNTKDYEKSPKNTYYTYSDFFPSLNLAFNSDEKNLLRFSYGRTTNRQEFREVSPMIFYDFDLAANVQGNYSLLPAYVNNLDLGYEFYPDAGEIISLSFFYKYFKNPVEWTYTVNGGTDLTYSYINALAANNLGVEMDVRKNLNFIGLNNFSINFNGALIQSKVKFPEGGKEEDRPMQGQSPYLINTGVFYHNQDNSWTAALLYNRIGKRITGIGRSLGSEGEKSRIPDSYEMPRNAVDLSISRKIGSHFEVKLAARDLTAEKVSFIQFAETPGGKIEQITRRYSPGRNFNLSLTGKF